MFKMINELKILDEDMIKSRIHAIRGQQVMLDEDLAALYEVSTKRLNEQVRRNIERFPENFMIQLLKSEYNSLRSHFPTLEKGRGTHRKYFPYAFTEQGVAMLSGVLKSDIAVKVSIHIMDAFVAMRRFLTTNAQVFYRLDDIERKQVVEKPKPLNICNTYIVYNAYKICKDVVIMQTIKIITKSKSSSIRISERTKKMLEALSVGKETHEQIILRLIGLVDKISSEDGTMITEKKNILGIKYSRRNEKIVIETRKNKYSIVFTYNDLTPFMKFRILQLKDSNIERKATKWEVDLNLVNIATNNGKWIDPKKSKIDKREMLLVYLVILLKILDNFFDIYGHEIYDESDYLNMDNWRKLYHRNNLSMESFYDDVEKKFAEVKI